MDRDVVDAFGRDGAVVVRGLFTPAEVEQVRDGIDAALAAPGPLFQQASGDDDPGRFVEDFCTWQRIEQFRRIAFDSRAADVAAALMGCRTVRLFHDHVLVKEAGTRAQTPWHQDQPYYNVDGRQNCSMWMPVDPVPREATLEFWAGSHRRGWLTPRSFHTHEAKWFPEGTLADLPDIEADRAGYNILGWALEPGDVVFFHMLTVHHAAGSAGRRRAFSLRFLGEDMVHAPRPWRTSPQFDGLEAELPAGAPLDHPLFPLLRG